MADLENLIHLDLINAIEEMENDILTDRRVFEKVDAFQLTDIQFIKLFRLPKQVALQLIEIVETYIVAPSRTSALDIQTKVLTALRFYATGSYQTNVGYDLYTAVSQASVSRCVAEVSEALNHANIFQQWIKFPSTLQELQIIRNEFFKTFNIPGVVGCIDCTHVAIIAPKDEEHIYVNRKGYHSINVQLVCDSRMRITHVCARYPGSTNDSYIWNRSSLKDYFLNLHQRDCTDYFLLGDSGYALRSYMMTPIINPEPAIGTPEYHYNTRQMKTRSIIERCNGLLKMRFRCLLKHRVLHYQPQIACKIINACIVLHNMCVEYNVPESNILENCGEEIDLGLSNDLNEEQQQMQRVNPELVKGRTAQRKLIRNFFT